MHQGIFQQSVGIAVRQHDAMAAILRDGRNEGLKQPVRGENASPVPQHGGRQAHRLQRLGLRPRLLESDAKREHGRPRQMRP